MPIGMNGAMRIVREVLETDTLNVNRVLVLAPGDRVPDRGLDGSVVAVLRPDRTTRQIIELDGGHKGGVAVYEVEHSIECTLLVEPGTIDFFARVETVAERITLAMVDVNAHHELRYVTASDTQFEREVSEYENRRVATLTVVVGELKTGGLSS